MGRASLSIISCRVSVSKPAGSERYRGTNCSVMAPQAGNAWGQIRPTEPSWTVWRFTSGGAGKLKRRSPVGGAA